jgi:hypothetical protein
MRTAYTLLLLPSLTYSQETETTTEECRDVYSTCQAFAATYCNHENQIMRERYQENCKKSCGMCQDDTVDTNEDALIESPGKFQALFPRFLKLCLATKF